MSASNPRPLLEEVLDAYSVEPKPGGDTLKQYLKDYPEYAGELVDLSRELSRFIVEEDESLSTSDDARINEAWERHVAAGSGPVRDPLAGLSVADLRTLSAKLGVPRQVIAAFCERRVDVASVPRLFLKRLSKALNGSLDQLVASLALPSTPMLARSYKAETKPSASSPIAFSRLLKDAGLSDEQCATLMAEEE